MWFSAKYYQVGKTESLTWSRGPMSGHCTAYSITSPAWASIVDGLARPSAFAAFRMIGGLAGLVL